MERMGNGQKGPDSFLRRSKQMSTRLLTLLTTLAFLGFSVSVLAGKPDKCETWPNCDGGDGGGEELYDVRITEPGLVTGGGDRWKYNGRSIDYPTFNQPIGITYSLNLSFFEWHFGVQGPRCFGLSGTELHTAGFGKHKGSDAHGKFWFRGFTHHKDPDDRIQVLYLLIVDGDFQGDPKGWPENGGSGDNVMHMVDWELKVENAGANIANMSCEDSGSDDEFMTVFVEPSPPLSSP